MGRRLRTYLGELHRLDSHGDAREESFYPALRSLLLGHAVDRGHEDLQVTSQPRPTEGGNPDFRLWSGPHHVVGYVEAKAPGTDLGMVGRSEQVLRYRATFPNLLLTDFLTFHLFRDHERVATADLGPRTVLYRTGHPTARGVEDLADLLTRFLGFSLPRTFAAPALARELAHRTRFLRRIVLAEMRREEAAGGGRLRAFYGAFREFLIPHLTDEGFADLYAQTITYGLFAARTRAGDRFDRHVAVDHVPHTVGVLHDIFEFLSYGDLRPELAWIVDDLAQVLAHADVKRILDRYFHDGKGADPIVHFYETFLAEYDPHERDRRGVFYTPEPVVDYMVRGVEEILCTRLGRPEGWATPGLSVLDPAAGTMTFLVAAVERAAAARAEHVGGGSREGFLRDQVLGHFYGFELMMAPYTIGHLKIGYHLEELGHPLGPDERFQLYLTNTLEMDSPGQSELPGLDSLAREAAQAWHVKQETPVHVVFGNPPYSGHSVNTGEWIRSLVEDYKKDVPGLARPGQAKWLQDDYVKFIRFAEWKVEQAGEGVVALITNHAWLDNPTFRGMRRHLLRTFDEIRVLDLHGSTLRRERTPRGDPDQNVFDIRPGVAIVFLVKRPAVEPTAAARPDGGGDATVHHAELWGSRAEKYRWLGEHDLASTEWRRLDPRPGFHRFTPVDRSAEETYDRFVPLPAIFSRNGRPAPGIVTTHDEFAISWSKHEALENVRKLVHSEDEDRAREAFRLCSQEQWSYDRAKRELSHPKDPRQLRPGLEALARPMLYRPFDVRWTVWDRNVAVHRRMRVMRHMLAGPNLGLCTTRSVDIARGFHHAFCTRLPIQHHTVSIKEVNYLFPLYLYPQAPPDGLWADQPSASPVPNLHRSLLPLLEAAYRRPVDAEELFAYVYAVLFAPSYRETFADFLKIDFPRIPFPADEKLFATLAGFGRRLVGLHTLERSEVGSPSTRFHGEGGDVVAKNRSEGFAYDAEKEAVHINPGQRFAPVEEPVWSYRIGGYQVLHKWLKDRRQRELSAEEVRTYCLVATALARTVEIEAGIDDVYPAVEDDLLNVPLG